MIYPTLSSVLYRSMPISIQKPIRIAIADAHETLRYGLIALLSNTHGIEVVGAADSPDALRAVLLRNCADIIIFDLCSADQERIAMAHELSQLYPDSRILMFTEHISRYHAEQLLQAGM